MTAPPLSIELTRDLEDVRRASLAVRRWAEQRLEVGTARAIQLAFAEVATNAVLHAPSGAADRFSVCLSETRAECVLEFFDEGNPIPETALRRAERADRGLRENATSVGGHGLMLVSALMDRVHYRFSDGKSQFVMAVKRDPSGSGQ